MSVATFGGRKTFTAGEALSAFRLVRLSSGSGTQVEYCDAEDEPIGATLEAAASGANVTVRLLADPGTFKLSAAGAFSIGDVVYPAANGQVDDAPTSAGRGYFKALEAATAANDVVECMLYESPEGLLHAIIADGSTLTNSITETTLAGKTIEPDNLQAGDVIHVVAQGVVPDQNSTDTLTVKLYVGTEEIVTTGAVDSADDDIWFIDAYITIRATGASGAVQACGIVANGVEGTVTAKPFNKDQATEDISAAFEVAVKGTWSVAHADNQTHCEVFLVELLRQ